jgi:hypothetical protein
MEVIHPLFRSSVIRYLILTGIFGLTLLALAACAGGDSTPLSDISLDSPVLAVDGLGAPKTVNLSYRINEPSQVSLTLEGSGNTRYLIRQNEARPPGSYTTTLNGLVDLDENGLPQRRLLPNGNYHYILAVTSGNQSNSAQGQLSLSGNSNEGAPEISNLSAYPSVISPNFDALDDVTTLNWRISRPATVTVSISGQGGFNKTLKTIKNQPAQEDQLVFDGRDLKGDPLPDGIYTYIVTAADAYGQVTRRSSTLEVQGGGKPNVTVTSVDIGPEEIISGNQVTLRIKVKNTGKVPVRSQGPYSGFSYSSREVYSSIENGKYDEKAGFWRVGVDFEANNSAGAVRYPWRWGFGKEFLMPGEEAEIIGKIRIDRNEQRIVLYVGLIQEKIALRADRLKVVQVKISY